MQFNIDLDAGTAISAWVTPDNPSATPALVLSNPGYPDVNVAANVLRPDLREIGNHNTGLVGFFIDEVAVPELSKRTELCIRDAHSRILIHRRFVGLPCKLFVHDMSMSAAGSLAMKDQLGGRFTLAYDAVERYPFDTLFGILNNQVGRSIYASGRPSLIRHQNVLRANGFVCVAILRHPFEDLGLRLEIAQQAVLRTSADAALYSTGLDPLIEIMRTTNLGDLPALQAAMQRLTPSQAAIIANPQVRTLACSGDEPPDRHHIALALDNLATMDLVGSHSRYNHFRTSLSEILNEPVLENYAPDLSFFAKEAASMLARMESIRKLLALDLALHSYIEDAFNAAEAELHRREMRSDRPVL